MPIRAFWKRVVTTWKSFRPVRRRRRSIGFTGEAFEPRRMLSAFVVNSLADSHDAIPGDGIAADSNGFATVRAVLEEANARIGADTISLPAGVITLSATNGPLSITDDATILGHNESTIDGTPFDEVFSVSDSGRLHLDHVSVVSSSHSAIHVRPGLLTANARQADLIVAFSASPNSPLSVEIKASTGLSPLSAITAPDRDFDASLTTSTAKLTKTERQVPDFSDFSVPTPEEAIDRIINALFRSEPDFVLPVGTERKPGTISEGDAKPLPKPTPAENSLQDETPMSDDEQSRVDPVDDESVRTVLRDWANDAGWNEFDFLTCGSVAPRHGSRIAAIASALLGGVASKVWSQTLRDSWRDMFSLTALRRHLNRLRRQAH